MKNIGYFKHKKVVVVGLARSGLACADVLHSIGAEVRVTDTKDSVAAALNAEKLRAKGIAVELGKHSKEFLEGCDLMIISPGVSEEAKPVVWAKQSAIEVISEIEFAWQLCPAEVIAVTGSNGKTTVTTLIGEILKAAGRRVCVCGNIGNPFSGELPGMKEGDFVSLEVSSFQLEKIVSFKPKIAVLLNFSRNHLDRYKDMGEYLAAKKRLFMNQDDTDYVVLNDRDPVVRELAKEAKSKAVYFNTSEEYNPNLSVLLAVASILGIAEETAHKVFKEFRGIEHRLEFVTSINQVKFINDSKATTVDSAAWALRNVSGPVILIAGGIDKGNDYNQIIELAQKKVKRLVVIGEAKKKMGQAFKGVIPTEEAASLKEAIQKAFDSASKGDCVLLSPMCSSFDMFSNYEERGRLFKQTVSELARTNN